MANIHTNRKSGFIRRAGGMRRESLWFPIAATDVSPIAGGVLIASLNAAALALRPFTVVRTRVQLFGRTDQLVTDEQWIAAYGLAVVSDQAVAIGVTAIPTPITDLGSDLWFMHQFVSGQFSDNGEVAGVTEIPFIKDVDSKAMRKVEDGQDIAIVAELSTVGFGMNLISAGRQLIKLH